MINISVSPYHGILFACYKFNKGIVRIKECRLHSVANRSQWYVTARFTISLSCTFAFSPFFTSSPVRNYHHIRILNETEGIINVYDFVSFLQEGKMLAAKSERRDRFVSVGRVQWRHDCTCQSVNQRRPSLVRLLVSICLNRARLELQTSGFNKTIYI